MFNTNRLKYLAGVLVVVIVLGLTLTNYSQRSLAQEKKTVNQYLSLVGAYMKNNRSYVDESIKSLKGNDVAPENVIAEVNGLPITIGELNYRIGLRATANANSNVNDVFNYLVGEKVVLSYAMKNKLLPSEEELNEFIQREKQLYDTNQNYKDGIQSMIEAANITIDDYWNVYEYYNAFRVLVFKNAYNFGINEGITKGKVKRVKGSSAITQENYLSYWNNLKLEMISKASVKLGKPIYNNLQLSIDRTKLYFK